MNLLNTALGTIEILIDGEKIPYIAKEGRKIENLCPNVLGRYQIEVNYIPDGNKHSLSCVINNLEQINRTVESGENLECLSFYNKDRVKLSIALLGEQRDCHNGVLINATNDYDIEYLENEGFPPLKIKGKKLEKNMILLLILCLLLKVSYFVCFQENLLLE